MSELEIPKLVAIQPATLYVVATPIGNIADASSRVRHVLAGVNLVACEDTRVTGKMFERLGLTSPQLTSYHDKNEAGKAESIISEIKEKGMSVAIVSDAGTPCVSDPGFRVVSLAHKEGVRVIPVPGPSALLSIVMASGLPSDRFSFVGFLPHKKEARKQEMQGWEKKMGSIIFYESATRIVDTLKILCSIWPDSRLAIGRELTKTYEEIVSLTAQEALEWAVSKSQKNTLKGELVVMCDGFEKSLSQGGLEDELTRLAVEGFRKGLSHKKLLKELSHFPMERSELYAFLLEIKKSLKESD